jgi:hypothetical protein
LAVPNAFSRFGSFVHCRELVDHRRSSLADNLVLRIRSSRTTDCADNRAPIDQRDAASRGDDSIEREQIVEMQKLNTVLELLRFAPEGRGCSSLVFGDLNGGKHRPVHSLKGDEVAAGIDHRYVHLPTPFLRLRHRRVNNRLGSVE